jgi:hypothetical protein
MGRTCAGSHIPRPAAVGTPRLLSAIAMPYHDVIPPRCSSALRDDGSQLRCPRVRTRNEGFAPGVAGLGLPSHFHGFQGKDKPARRGAELKARPDPPRQAVDLRRLSCGSPQTVAPVWD